MSATDIVHYCRMTAKLAAVGAMLALTHPAFSQSGAVTDADIERAKRAQPIITEQDIELVRKKYRMPSEEELRRVPIPSSPNIDALPKPNVVRPLDLEAIAKGYEADADAIAQAHALNTGPGLLIFISFSIPEATLKRLVDQAAHANATLVIRGLLNGSLRDTLVRMQGLIGNHQVDAQIDPQAFDRFAITSTPSFVLVRDGAKPESCAGGSCISSDAFVTSAGDVSLDYALEYMQRAAPRFSQDAARFLKRIRG